MFCYYLLGPSPRDTFFPALPIYLHVSLSSPYQTNVLAPDLMGTGLWQVYSIAVLSICS